MCLSVLCIVDDDGIRGKIQNDLTYNEYQKLQTSANKLKQTIAGIQF